MVGFKELLRRLQIQEQMTKQHQTRVDVSTVPARLHSLNVKKKKKRLAGHGASSVSRTVYTDV